MTDSIFSEDTLSLAHFGKKGMKWGSHSAATPTTVSSRASKPKLSNQDIKDARARDASREAGIANATHALNLASTAKGQKAAAKTLVKLQNEQINSPDYKNSAKFTTGEKFVTGLALGSIAMSVLLRAAAHG